MNILLVYPEMPDTFWTMKHFNKALGKKSTYPPLGLMTIGAMMPKDWSKKLVDLNVSGLSDQDIQWADFVFISAMNVQIESVNAIIKQCKKQDAKIVAGGSLFTHEYERFPAIDYFVLNEAEITFPLFLEDLSKGEEHIKRTYQTTEFADVSTTPVPDYSLIKVDNYLYSILQYSRGCPYMCDFCDVTALFGRKPRIKSAEQIIAELEVIVSQAKNTVVLFADDNLIGNKYRLKTDLLPTLIKWRKEKQYPMYFATQLTINVADDDELIEMLLAAGFRHIFIGIETPEESGLELTKKKQNLRRNVMENVKKLHAAGFIISGGFIVGLDSDTPDIFNIQEEFIQASGIPLPIVNILKAPPGTELFDRIEKEGRLRGAFTFAEDDTNMEITMGDKELYAGFDRLVSNIYTPESSYKRIQQFLKDFNYAQVGENLKPQYSFKELLELAGFFVKIAFIYEERKYFWKLLFWIRRNRPKLLHLAIVNAVMIRQMNQTYKNMKPRLEQKLKVAAA